MRQNNIMKVRHERRIINKHRSELSDYVANFLRDSKGQTEEKVKEVYEMYESMWRRHAAFKNTHQDKKIVFTDAFESAVKVNGVRNVRANREKMTEGDYIDTMRIMKIVRHKNWFQKLRAKFFSKNER